WLYPPAPLASLKLPHPVEAFSQPPRSRINEDRTRQVRQSIGQIAPGRIAADLFPSQSRFQEMHVGVGLKGEFASFAERSILHRSGFKRVTHSLPSLHRHALVDRARLDSRGQGQKEEGLVIDHGLLV